MSINVQLLSRFVFLLLSMISFSGYAQEPAPDVKGAACIIRADNKLVMVHEIITKKLSLPAGRVEAGEDPAISAQRETWEETGLVVNINGVLGRTKDAIFYDCVSESDIVSFQFNNIHDGFELPIWFAPHYGIEISSAMLVDPRNIPANEYRFPEQMEWVTEITQKATDQSVLYVGNLVEAAPSFNQVELGWMLEFQHIILSLPDSIRDSVRGMIMGGNLLAEPFLLIILLPLVYLRYGKHFTYKIFFAVTVTSLMSLVAQQGFAFPRPHVYLPAVELVQTYGYSFPSTPAAIWLCIGVLILNAENKLSFNQLSVGFSAIILWLGLAKFYTGSAFMLDILSGALLGFLCSWHIIRLDGKPDVNAVELLSSKIVWFMLLAMCVVMGMFWPSPVVAYWFAIIATVIILLFTLKESEGVASSKTVYLLTMVLLAVNVAISLAANIVSTSTMLTLAVEVFRYPVLILLFVLTVRRTIQAA
tara:strand:- start:2012 stop:3439 length:1428 start_codon:yes stop_codon:yes gene_type:complete